MSETNPATKPLEAIGGVKANSGPNGEKKKRNNNNNNNRKKNSKLKEASDSDPIEAKDHKKVNQDPRKEPSPPSADMERKDTKAEEQPKAPKQPKDQKDTKQPEGDAGEIAGEAKASSTLDAAAKATESGKPGKNGKNGKKKNKIQADADPLARSTGSPPVDPGMSKYTEVISKRCRNMSKRLQKIKLIEEGVQKDPSKYEKEQLDAVAKKDDLAQQAIELEGIKEQFNKFDAEGVADKSRTEKQAKRESYSLMREMATLMLAIATLDKYNPVSEEDITAHKKISDFVSELSASGGKAGTQKGATVLSKILTEFVDPSNDSKSQVNHLLNSAPFADALAQLVSNNLSEATESVSAAEQSSATIESANDKASQPPSNQQTKSKRNKNRKNKTADSKKDSVKPATPSEAEPLVAPQAVSKAGADDTEVQFIGDSVLRNSKAEATKTPPVDDNKAAIDGVIADPAVANAILATPPQSSSAETTGGDSVGGTQGGRGRGGRKGRGRGRGRGRGDGRGRGRGGKNKGEGRGQATSAPVSQ